MAPDSTEVAMTGSVVAWGAVGIAVGVVHALSLCHAARLRTRVGFPVGMFVAAMTLIVAALAGRILPAAAGWMCGLVVASGTVLVRSRWT